VLRATLKSLFAHKLRMGMSAFAIVLGVAFVAGTLIFTDTLSSSFSQLFAQTAPDVTVRPAQAASAAAGGFTGADSRTVPAAAVDELGALGGVERADGNITNQGTYIIGRDGKVIGSGGGAPGIGGNFNDAPAADGSAIVTVLPGGTAPDGPNQVVIDEKSATTAGFQIGDTVQLVTTGAEPAVSATLVGTVRFGETGNLIGATLALFDTPTAQRLYLGGADVYNDIAVTGDGSLSNLALRDEIAATLPADLEAVDDAEFAAENQDQLEQGLSFITTFLLVFAAVALVVGSFLILNTFSIIVAQRTRELALFRALGASKAQVTRSVLVEALVVGLVGSTVGLALGFGLAAGLRSLFGAIGIDLGSAGLVFQPRTVLAAYAVGVVITLLAAYLPARKAARVPPVAAMRDDVAIPKSSMRRRLIGGAALTLLGAGLMIWALAFDGGLQPLGGGVLAVFVGVALLSPVISRPIIATIAGGYPRMFGTVGVLAKENARRNPRRTAATASALMIGLALVTTMAVLGQSTKSSVDELVKSDLLADYVVSNAVQAPFSPAIAPEIAAVPGVSAAVPFRFGAAEIGGEQTFVAAFDGQAMSKVVSITVDAGELNTATDGALVISDRAQADGWQVGDPITLGLPAGPVEVTITGVVENSPFIGAEIVVPPAALEAGGVVPADSIVYISRAADADPASVQAGIEGVLADLPTVTVKDQDAFAADQRAPVDQLLAIIYALLGLAVIIAVLGIVNTLALSVIERTREVGLLRAIGMSRRQLRSMIRLESVAISVLGAVLGIGLGLIFGISLQQAIADEGINVLSIPFVQLLIFVVLAGVVGVLAAVWPARRAARMDVLRAITAE
jgi:putative ABC transport system permease protein